MTTDQKLKEAVLEFTKIKPVLEELLQTFKDFPKEREIKLDKPTRYYPNGAYMDCKDVGTYWFIHLNMYVHGSGCTGAKDDIDRLDSQNCFPTRKAAEKGLNRQKLTANMYRDMRDERINGDWVADWDNDSTYKFFPRLTSKGDLDFDYTSWISPAHDFIYMERTFIEDLKSLGWSTEELKIVWFNK